MPLQRRRTPRLVRNATGQRDERPAIGGRSKGCTHVRSPSKCSPQICAAKPAPRWRRARQAPTSTGGREEPGGCPVASIAADAAQLLRLRAALGCPRHAPTDRLLAEALADPDDCLRAESLRTEAWERLRALRHWAGLLRPTSMKGVLFQLNIAAEYAQATDAYLITKLSIADERALDARDRQIERLNRAVIAHLETMVMDDDLAVLRAHYLPDLFDVRAMQTGDPRPHRPHRRSQSASIDLEGARAGGLTHRAGPAAARRPRGPAPHRQIHRRVRRRQVKSLSDPANIGS